MANHDMAQNKYKFNECIQKIIKEIKNLIDLQNIKRLFFHNFHNSIINFDPNTEQKTYFYISYT